MKNNKTIIVSVAIILAVGVLAFFGGTKYQEGKVGSGEPNRQQTDGFGNRNDAQNGQEKPGGERGVTGEIINAEDKPIIGMAVTPATTSAKSADAKEIIVAGTNYKFSPNTVTVKKGVKTRILFKNTGGMHDFRVDELNIATRIIQGGEEDFVEFTAEKTGQYEFYCSVGNHRQMGMKGTLTVE